MDTRMSLETRRELLEQLKERYRWANRTERSRILDDFTASTDYARKHAIVLLNGSRAVPTAQPSRKRRYDEQVRQALTQLWQIPSDPLRRARNRPKSGHPTPSSRAYKHNGFGPQARTASSRRASRGIEMDTQLKVGFFLRQNSNTG